MSWHLVSDIVVAIAVAGIVGVFGAAITHGRKAHKSSSDLMITEARIAVLLTRVNDVLEYEERKTG